MNGFIIGAVVLIGAAVVAVLLPTPPGWVVLAALVVFIIWFGTYRPGQMRRARRRNNR
jgi:hypothetical protein